MWKNVRFSVRKMFEKPVKFYSRFFFIAAKLQENFIDFKTKPLELLSFAFKFCLLRYKLLVVSRCFKERLQDLIM